MKELFPEIPYVKGERIILKKIGPEAADGLKEIAQSPSVRKYLPTFLYEQQYEDMEDAIAYFYDEGLEESLFLGIYMENEFCGILELYGYREQIHKISVGCRLIEKAWGKGIATEAVSLIVDYLYSETSIEIITASTMVENNGSNHVVEKCGFTLVVSGSEEDWGFPEPTLANKWIR